ncbi:hypothetical protein, partial [Streptomyces sp. GbtcB7]|uniref:hypothetical protein n=1 Tax=Streptomyces sp. GbtcB7 TaxID=2824752 RepID=UPI001C2F7D56
TALGGNGTSPAPAAKSSYPLVVGPQRTAVWAAYSTATHTEWSFASAHTDQQRALGLISVDYDAAGLNLLNSAEAGHTS